jgi:hypothetical protein
MKRRERTDAIKRQRTTGSKACEKGNSSTSGTTRFHSKSGGNNHYVIHSLTGWGEFHMLGCGLLSFPANVSDSPRKVIMGSLRLAAGGVWGRCETLTSVPRQLLCLVKLHVYIE